jgi:hypothetical protein
MEQFQTNIHNCVEKVMSTQRTKLMDMHNANHLKINNDFREAEEAFNSRIEQHIEQVIE